MAGRWSRGCWNDVWSIDEMRGCGWSTAQTTATSWVWRPDEEITREWREQNGQHLVVTKYHHILSRTASLYYNYPTITQLTYSWKMKEYRQNEELETACRMRIRKDDGLTYWGWSCCVTKQQTTTTPWTSVIWTNPPTETSPTLIDITCTMN